jgi:hypothetical protein
MIGRPRGPALLLGTVVAVVLVVLGVGLWIVGSPAEQRRKALDQERIEALRDLDRAVGHFRKESGELPPDLAALTEWEGLEKPRTDPVSDEPYSYQPSGERSYRLCATFALASSGPMPRHLYEDGPSVWNHPAGHHCFTLEVASKGG